MARGGHPLGLIDYMIERVYQGFLSFELQKFGIFWNLYQPKGVPTYHFHQPKFCRGAPISHFSSTQRFLGGAHLLLFINHNFLEGCPPLTFHQPKGFLGVPTSHFYEKSEVGTPLKTWVDEKSEVGTPQKLGLMKSQRSVPPKKPLG